MQRASIEMQVKCGFAAADFSCVDFVGSEDKHFTGAKLDHR